MLDKIIHLDLFSGMGGFSLCLKDIADKRLIDYQCIDYIDIKKSAINILKENFNKDIKEINIENFKNYLSDDYHFNFLTAGFPCQPFSSAGNLQGFDDEKGRGKMFFYIADILLKKKPKYFLLENVSNLIRHDKGNTFEVIKQTLSNIGYKYSYGVYNSYNFGLPQKRERIFIYGIYDENKKIIDIDYKLSSIEKKVNENKLSNSFFKDIIEDYDISSLKFSSKEIDFFRKIESYLKQNNLNFDFLGGKCINDKRGGVNNIHSWEIGLFGDLNEKEKYFLNSLLLENRKTKHNIYNTDKLDGIPLSKNQILDIYSNIYTHDEILNILHNLSNLGYLNKYKLLKDKGKNKFYKLNKNNNFYYNENLYIEDDFYSVISNKLKFPFYNFISNESVLKTLTATDAEKVGVILNNNGNLLIRKLTNRELLRCLGYPENYTINCYSDFDKNVFDLIGNTIPIPVARMIADELISIV